jgi:hypothetical protein
MRASTNASANASSNCTANARATFATITKSFTDAGSWLSWRYFGGVFQIVPW